MGTVRQRRELVSALQRIGTIRSEAVGEAFLAVPREGFVSPEALRAQGVSSVYEDQAIVTRKDARGYPTSSSSQPSIMAGMLEALRVEPGMRVLEVGTGTGYNAALLSFLVGPGGRVTSVDVQPDLIADARRGLRAGGWKVRLASGDGRWGWVPDAPYDRIIVTASARDVPVAWRDQLVPDGVLVTPLQLNDAHEGPQAVVALRRRRSGFAWEETICGGFMRLRSEADELDAESTHLIAGAQVDGRYSPLLQLSSRYLRNLGDDARRAVVHVASGPSRRRPLSAPVSGRAIMDLVTFVACAVDARHLVQSSGTWPIAGPGVLQPGSLAILGGTKKSYRRIDAWGGPGAEEALAAVVEQWRELGCPRTERLRVRVSYGRPPAGARRKSRRRSCVIAYDW